MANLKIPVDGKIEVDFSDEAKELLKQFVHATEKGCSQIVWHEIKKEGLPPLSGNGSSDRVLLTVCYADTREDQYKYKFTSSATMSGIYNDGRGWLHDLENYTRIVDYDYAEVTHWAEMPKPAVKFSE